METLAKKNGVFHCYLLVFDKIKKGPLIINVEDSRSKIRLIFS